MKKQVLNWKWIIPMLIFALLVVACGTETPVAEQPLPESPETTATLGPAEAVPTMAPETPPENESTPEPRPEPTAAQPETGQSQTLTGWQAVSQRGNWVLIGYGDALNPVIVEPDSYVTINFNAGNDQVIGSGGCNSFFSSYAADDAGKLTIQGPVGATRLACETGMEQEALFLAALETVSGYTVTEDKHLLLDYDSGTAYAEQFVFVPEASLVDTVWVLTAYGQLDNLTPSQPDVISTVIFSADDSVSGFAGCNQFTAGYQAQEQQIDIRLPAANLMLCEKGMQQEQDFLQLLGAVRTYRLGIGTLELGTEDGSQVMRFSAEHLPLENVRWQLAEVDGQPLPEGVVANALFTPANSPAAQGQENTVNGSAGCNTFFGPYTLTSGTLSLGPLGATLMMCEAAVMQVEQAFLAGLDGMQGYEIIGHQLIIYTESGSLLFYADRLPLEGPRWILTGSGSVGDPQLPGGGAVFTANFARQFGLPSGIKSGDTGCNNYTATYYAGPEVLKVNLPQTSQHTCSDVQSEAEQGYFLGLNAAHDYRILGSELYVYYGDNVLIFVGGYPSSGDGSVPEPGPLTPLDGTQWWLTSIGATSVLPGTEVTIQFEINSGGRTGRVNGSASCNTYNADIADVFVLWTITGSNAVCETPEGIMDQETAYLNALQRSSDIQLEGEVLTITTQQGTLFFTKNNPNPDQPTPTPTGPNAVINAPRHVYVGQSVTFSGAKSSSGAEIVAYDWWFTGDVMASGIQVERTYSKPGVYDAILTIRDANGERAEGSMKINIHVYLEGQTWVKESTKITIKFNGGNVSGFAGCNDYSGTYIATITPGGGTDMTIESIATTGKVCSGDVMDREQAFLANLQAVTIYRINFDVLKLDFPDGTLIFNPAGSQ